MAIGLSEVIRNARLDAISGAINAGAAAGSLKLYTATRPATGAAITDQTLLATLVFAFPCADPATGGVLTFTSFDDDPLVLAAESGTCAWARAADSAGNFVADFLVTASGGGGDIEISDVALVAGNRVVVTAAALTEGNA